MYRETANDEQNLVVNWPVMFDERALVRSPVREQGRRRHDEKNDIDGKLTQVDVSSCTEKLFLSHYNNQRAPSCTSVRYRQSTGVESTYCIVIQRMPTWNSRQSRSTTNCRSKNRVHKAFKELTAWVLLIVEFNEVNMMALQTRLQDLSSGKRWSDNHSIFWRTVISLTKVGIQYL